MLDSGTGEDDESDESDTDSDPEVIRYMLWNDNAETLFHATNPKFRQKGGWMSRSYGALLTAVARRIT